MLEKIRNQLIELRQHPEPDETTFEDAASLLKQANELAIQYGIPFEPIGRMCNPADALNIVTRYLLAIKQAGTTLELVTTKEAAKLLNISERSLWNYAESGELPRVRMGSAIRYHKDDLQTFIRGKK